jgi:hypothetical protein
MSALLITCPEDAVEEVDTVLGAHGVVSQRSPRRNLDGSAVTSWMVVAAVAVRTAPAVLESLRDLLNRGRVEEISFGDVKIVNPRPDDVEKLIEVIRERETGG